MFIEVIGWTGTVLILSAYFLVSSKKLDSQGPLYQLANLFGAGFVATNAFSNSAWPVFGLNIAWGMISAWAIFNYIVLKK